MRRLEDEQRVAELLFVPWAPHGVFGTCDVMWSFHSRLGARAPTIQSLWPHGSLLAVWLLLICYPHPPAVDWPQHTAMAGVLAKLLAHDPCVSAYYALNPQTTPYHLLYVVLMPLVWCFGNRWGGTLVLMGLAALTHWVLILGAKVMDRPIWLAAYSPLLFFGVNFAWGFGPTMMGLPLMLGNIVHMAALWARPHYRHVIWAGLLGALAVASHVIFLPCCLFVALPFVLHGGPHIKRKVFMVGLLSTVPVWPHTWHTLMAPASPLPMMRFEDLEQGWDHLRMHFARFDRGLTRGAHQVWVMGCLGVTLLLFKRRTGQERYVAGLALALVLSLWYVPIQIQTRPNFAWMLNVRFLTLADACLLWVAIPAKARCPRWVAPLLSVVVVVFLLGMQRIYRDLAIAAAPVDALQATVPQGTLWGPNIEPKRFGAAWPPLDRHLLLTLTPSPVCFSRLLFEGGHLPVRLKAIPADCETPTGWP